MTNDSEHVFRYLLAAHISSLEKNVYSIVFLFLSCSELFIYSGHNSPIIYDFYRWKYLQIFFPQFGNCLFAFLMMFFEAQNHFILMKSNLSIISFTDCAVLLDPRNYCLTRNHQKSQRFTPVFSSEDFIFLALTFRSVSHFELIFAHGG